jgi:ketosteroid isomerase-like protein
MPVRVGCPVPHAHADLIERFYSAFAKRDAASMRACYHADVEFSDPVFPRLRGAEVGKMWTMLCERGADLQIEHRDVSADDRAGAAHWDARYTFSATGRKVLNQIDATFEFRDGLIVRHTDRFGFYKWARQALGPMGLLLGWTPLVRNKVRAMAAKNLAAFKA